MAVNKLYSVKVQTSGQTEIKRVAIDGPVFDNDESVQLVRRPPLVAGYKIELPLMNTGGAIVIREWKSPAWK